MTLYWNSLDDRAKLEAVLNQSQIVVASGDTVLGLLASMDEQSYNLLNDMKQRSDKPYLVLIRSVDMLSTFIDQPLSDDLKQLVSQVWPGPVTLIFKARADLPAFMKSQDGTIALRVPQHEGLLQLLQAYDGLFSTSANLHTEPIPEHIDSLHTSIISKAAALCYEKGVSTYPVIPSTILDCSTGVIQVIRIGCSLDDKVKSFLGND